MASRLAMYARFISGMPAFLRNPMSLDAAKAQLRERLAARESNFLRLAELAVFSRPESPYNFVFREAGVEAGDVKKLVRDDGLDSALGKLYDAGVHISYDEFKGRKPIIRNGRELVTSDDSFDNPATAIAYEAESGGSSGAPTRVRANLAHLESTMAGLLVAMEANGLDGAPTILYRPGLPCTVAVNTALAHIVFGNPVQRWFAPVKAHQTNSPMRFRVAGALTPGLVRLCGYPFPVQEFVSFADAAIVARAASELAAKHGRCLVKCNVSTALTVSTEAVKHGIDLTGVGFVGAGEPATPAKVNGIRASGGRYVASYSMTEVGPVGGGCAEGLDATDVHFNRDRLAMVQRSQTLPGLEEEAGVFHFTTLLPTAPKILINVSSDDFGILEERRCGCLLGELGFHQHVRQIRSVSKLTGRGITLVHSDIAHIIEEVLPARFGGTSQDYQLVEEEDSAGATQFHLLVSPSVSLNDESAPGEVLLEALSRGTPGAALQSATIRNGQAVRVRRQKPVRTARGKLPVFRTASSR